MSGKTATTKKKREKGKRVCFSRAYRNDSLYLLFVASEHACFQLVEKRGKVLGRRRRLSEVVTASCIGLYKNVISGTLQLHLDDDPLLFVAGDSRLYSIGSRIYTQTSNKKNKILAGLDGARSQWPGKS